jgi:hypothetical protein
MDIGSQSIEIRCNEIEAKIEIKKRLKYERIK